MRALRFLTCVVVLAALAGCGGDEDDDQASPPVPAATATADATPEPPAGENAAALAKRPAGEAGLRVPATRARVVAKASEFGRVLFDANGQVVYVFEPDSRNRSACTSDDCVEAWPPMLTKEPPTAGAGVDAAMLGTIQRDDGSLQVTYAGRPLYFYEHEGPGEIRCHNVDLHGGLWWVVTPAGEPAE
jgi:predicted lipoprotein with Yx(FWY)xxD motif